MFIENGYDEKLLRNITHQFHQKRQNKNKIPSECNNPPVVSLPWVPGLSPKLRKIFRKAGYRAVFKSNPNLRSLLTSKNKTKLPSNSQPGTYIIKCNCSKVYIGETKILVSTRMHQHQKSINENKPNQSALAYHKTFCKENIIWEKTRTLKVENKKFERKIREALEIQNNMCSARNGGINLDEGQYVKTMFWTPFLKFKNQKKPFNR
ncbi:uncharacterized protein LOC136086407 [Hydra vulgaris]|uniref:Uncharacterized protein LOC136086407 n=1 Tax=Hydra vulgaris TaxID=6087 RepID=A0ABM4CSA4_HYDVU